MNCSVSGPASASVLSITAFKRRPNALRRTARCNQILPDLDQDMREAQHCPVTIEAVVFELARIGLVVAHIEPNPLEALDQGPRDALIAVPKNSDFPRAARDLSKRA